MKKPKKSKEQPNLKCVEVEGKRWKFIITNKFGRKYSDCDGLCCFETKTILLRPYLFKNEDKEELLRTLIHDLIHSKCPFFDEQTVEELESILWSGIKQIL